jgi:hypothetical protein
MVSGDEQIGDSKCRVHVTKSWVLNGLGGRQAGVIVVVVLVAVRLHNIAKIPEQRITRWKVVNEKY